ncbi:hypothetical protein RRG08_015293 [Elysia crispata]|uniref:Uncharacterized protein n=1 Tax=Elysia crispata TaxID=231223 RepID=A0AAE0ZUT5_9GAST|nr:hypothetical protein RRG08_015293 [Elysia crispata]
MTRKDLGVIDKQQWRLPYYVIFIGLLIRISYLLEKKQLTTYHLTLDGQDTKIKEDNSRFSPYSSGHIVYKVRGCEDATHGGNDDLTGEICTDV